MHVTVRVVPTSPLIATTISKFGSAFDQGPMHYLVKERPNELWYYVYNTSVNTIIVKQT